MNTDSFYQGIRLGAIIRLINYNKAGYSEYTPILFISFDSVSTTNFKSFATKESI